MTALEVVEASKHLGDWEYGSRVANGQKFRIIRCKNDDCPLIAVAKSKGMRIDEFQKASGFLVGYISAKLELTVTEAKWLLDAVDGVDQSAQDVVASVLGIRTL